MIIDVAPATGVNWHSVLANTASVGTVVGGIVSWTLRRVASRRKDHERWITTAITVAVREASIALGRQLADVNGKVDAQARTLDEVQRRVGNMERALMSRK